MAITLIVGKPGAGKSYEAVRNHVIPDVKAGRKIITNLPLNLPRFREEWPMLNMSLFEVRQPKEGRLVPFSTVDEFQDDWQDPDKGWGPHYIIDECHEAFPKTSKDLAILNMFTMHRHKGIDITLITQQVPQVRRDIVGLCRTVIELQNNANIGLGRGSYRKWVKDGYGKTAAVMSGPSVEKYDKRIFQFYSSYTQGGKAEKIKAARPIWLHPFFLCLYVLIIGVVYLVATTKPWKIITDPTGQAAKKAEQVELVEVKPPEPVAVVPQPVVKTLPAQKSVVQVQPQATTSPPMELYAPPPPPEPVEPVYDDGELVVPNVRDFVAVRGGNRCSFRLVVGNRNTEIWEWTLLGWKVEMIPHDGKDREKYGSCTLKMTRGEEPFRYEMQWHMNRNEVFTPPRRFASTGPRPDAAGENQVITPDIVGAVNEMIPFAKTPEKKSSPEQKL